MMRVSSFPARPLDRRDAVCGVEAADHLVVLPDEQPATMAMTCSAPSMFERHAALVPSRTSLRRKQLFGA